MSDDDAVLTTIRRWAEALPADRRPTAEEVDALRDALDEPINDLCTDFGNRCGLLAAAAVRSGWQS